MASADAAPRARTAAHRHAPPRSGLSRAGSPRSAAPRSATRRPDPADRTRALERRRREQHFRARRRDLLVDTVAALVVALILITVTAGLGVVALIVGPVAVALVASTVLSRFLARRRARFARAPRRR